MALGALAGATLAAQTQTTFDLTGVVGQSLDGVDTSPYYAQIGGSSTSTAVVCDDFANNSYLPEDWNAYVTPLSSVPSAPGDDLTLKWKDANSGAAIDGYSWSLDQKTAYTVAAYLVLEIDEGKNTPTQQEDLSFALWELFDARGGDANPGYTSNSDNVVNWLSGDQTTLDAATMDVKAAITAVQGNPNIMSGYSVNIYSYNSAINPGGPTNCNGSCAPPPQEFITVPDGTSSLAAFGVYLLVGAAGLLFFGRRGIFRTNN